MQESILKNIDFTIKNLQENVFRVKRNEKNEIVYTFNEGPIPRNYNACTNVVYGKTIIEIIGQENAMEVLPYFEEAFTGKVTSYQLNVGDFIFQTVLSPVEIEGNIIEVSGTSFDITEKVKREEELAIAYGKLKELNESKNRLFSIIAHDLRGPLGALMNLIVFAKDYLNEKSYDDLSNLLDVCQKAAENSYILLEELFDWAKNQIEEVEFKPEIFNMSDIVIKCIDYLRFLAENKSITIQFENNERIDVFGDKNTIITVIRNLISNAIKFSFENSIINIEIMVEEDECLVFVKDNGVGISKERIGSIFEFQEGISTEGTKGEKGTGFGLGLCAEFIKKNKGKIDVKSAINKGSTFYFSIPCSHSLQKQN
jgi:signal transduction histidine kinase